MRLRHACLSLAGTALLAAMDTAHAEIAREDVRVAGEPGIELFVREVRDTDTGRNGAPMILLHGARVPGIASFDLPVPGGSLAEDLARAGHRVFIMDARGYGGSTRPAAMLGAPEGQPLVGSHEVVRDLDAVVNWVQARTGRHQVALLGWATGGHWAGMYASLHPGKVSHLVVYNGLYGAHRGHASLGPGSEAEDAGNPGRFNARRFGTYRFNTAASLMPAWDRAIPVEDKSQWRDPRIAEAYRQEALRSDPTSAERNPPAFRAPSGALEDSFYLTSGRQLWDAASVTARVLIVRSEKDFWSRPEDVTELAQHLVRAAAVETVTIPGATHHVHLDRPERGRDRFLSTVEAFLGGGAVAASRREGGVPAD